MSTIITIVEGQGEVSAVPILIRRIAAAVPSVVPQVPKPIRVKRNRFLKENELERYVDLAARQAGSDGRILIILDADDDCPPERASEILQRATAARSVAVFGLCWRGASTRPGSRGCRLYRWTPRAS